MRKPFDLNRFTTGTPAFISLADGREVTCTPAPMAAVGNYFGITLMKVGDEVLDHALFTRDGHLNTGFEMYMKGEKIKRWVNVYQLADGAYAFGTRASMTEQDAAILRDSQRAIARVAVEFEV